MIPILPIPALWILTAYCLYALYGCWMFTIGTGEYFYKGPR